MLCIVWRCVAKQNISPRTIRSHGTEYATCTVRDSPLTMAASTTASEEQASRIDSDSAELLDINPLKELARTSLIHALNSVCSPTPHRAIRILMKCARSMVQRLLCWTLR